MGLSCCDIVAATVSQHVAIPFSLFGLGTISCYNDEDIKDPEKQLTSLKFLIVPLTAAWFLLLLECAVSRYPLSR
jgi:hypothetical protein